ncbi:GntR family transcriptional regulator [Streptomyces sp. M19]
MAGQNLFLSKSDLAYAELRDRILSGTLPAGSRLAQYDLAESLNMSITPLREAIRRLSGEGLLTVDTHRDVRVSAMNAPEARQLFEVRLSWTRPPPNSRPGGARTTTSPPCGPPSTNSSPSRAPGARTLSRLIAPSTGRSTAPRTTTSSSASWTTSGTSRTDTAASASNSRPVTSPAPGTSRSTTGSSR